MTTIVADLSRIGCDTFWSPTGERSSKIWRTKNKGVFGCSGDERIIARFQDWISGGKRPNQIEDDAKNGDSFAALQLHNGELFVWGWAMHPRKSIRAFHAIGSGADLALGALAAGGTLEQALEIAADFDAATKGPFRFLKAS